MPDAGPHAMPDAEPDAEPHAGGDRTVSTEGSGQAQSTLCGHEAPLRERARAVMEDAWVAEHSYTAPNPTRYPHQWLWDSCFHSLIWLELGCPERALAELRSALLPIDESGHVPHMRYRSDPQRSVGLWGQAGRSSITQPPVYGHALAVLLSAGVGGADELIAPARQGLRFLLQRRRRHRSGLLLAAHPWETGCDDSPRFDDFCPGERFDRQRWAAHKIDLLSAVDRGAHGEPLWNPAFDAAPVSLSAITAANALALGAVIGDDDLAALSVELAEAVDACWDPDAASWADQGSAASGSARTRTADGLLGLLVSEDPIRRALVEGLLADPVAYGGPFGPRGVHPDEAAYDPDAYWRGPVWPQLAYLLGRQLSEPGASRLAETTRAGAAASGLAEHWNPETGAPGGAVPQSWTGLALLIGRGSESR